MGNKGTQMLNTQQIYLLGSVFLVNIKWETWKCRKSQRVRKPLSVGSGAGFMKGPGTGRKRNYPVDVLVSPAGCENWDVRDCNGCLFFSSLEFTAQAAAVPWGSSRASGLMELRPWWDWLITQSAFGRLWGRFHVLRAEVGPWAGAGGDGWLLSNCSGVNTATSPPVGRWTVTSIAIDSLVFSGCGLGVWVLWQLSKMITKDLLPKYDLHGGTWQCVKVLNHPVILL